MQEAVVQHSATAVHHQSSQTHQTVVVAVVVPPPDHRQVQNSTAVQRREEQWCRKETFVGCFQMQELITQKAHQASFQMKEAEKVLLLLLLPLAMESNQNWPNCHSQTLLQLVVAQKQVK